MCVLSIKVPIRKKSGNLSYAPRISTNNITELNGLIYAGAKLVCEKSTKEKSKPGWEFRLETLIKNLRKQAKMIQQKKDDGIIRKRKEKAIQEKLKIRLQINQKVQAKEGRLKRYRQTIQ